MKRIVIAICALVVLHSFAMAQVIPGRYIVELKKDASPASTIKAHGIAPDFIYKSAVKGFAGNIPPGKLKALKQDPNVVSITPDRVIKLIDNIGPLAKGGNGKPSGPAAQVVPAGVNRIGAAPSQATFSGQGIGVAIVDTGIDLAHTDLRVSSSSYWAYSTSAQDDHGHGTHVGGIVAAKNNTTDVVGVATSATLYAVKVLNASGSGSDSAITAGLDWIAANAATVTPPIRVVNMSLGREGSLNDNPTMRASFQSLYNMGIVIVVAAGNDPTLGVSQQVPPTYPEVLSVASTSALNGASKYPGYSGIAADTASYFTSDGAFSTSTRIGVTISAPGEDQENVSRAGMITSVGILSTKLGGGTTRMSGTSMASPHVAGVVARILEAAGSTALDVETVRGLIRSNAHGAGSDPLDSPTTSYSYDGQREGIVQVPELW